MQIPLKASVDGREVELKMSMYFDHQWDGDRFHGMYHGIVYRDHESSPTPVYVTHVVAPTVKELVAKAEVHAEAFVRGDFYPLLDPDTVNYATMGDTIL